MLFVRNFAQNEKSALDQISSNRIRIFEVSDGLKTSQQAIQKLLAYEIYINNTDVCQLFGARAGYHFVIVRG